MKEARRSSSMQPRSISKIHFQKLVKSIAQKFQNKKLKMFDHAFKIHNRSFTSTQSRFLSEIEYSKSKSRSNQINSSEKSYLKVKKNAAEYYQKQNEKIRENLEKGIRFEKKALEILHIYTEEKLVRLFEEAYMCTRHAKRVTLMTKDIKLLSKIKKNSLL